MIEIVKAENPEQIQQVRDLLAEYQAFLRAEVDNEFIEDDVPPVAGFAEEMAALPGVYAPPAGRLLLALNNGEPVGCIGLRPFAGTTGEIKRLWVRPSARGLKAGRALTETLISEARAAGYVRLLLSTSDKLAEAQRLYVSLGFVPVEPYFYMPEAMLAHEIFLQLELDAVQGN